MATLLGFSILTIRDFYFQIQSILIPGTHESFYHQIDARLNWLDVLVMVLEMLTPSGKYLEGDHPILNMMSMLRS